MPPFLLPPLSGRGRSGTGSTARKEGASYAKAEGEEKRRIKCLNFEETARKRGRERHFLCQKLEWNEKERKEKKRFQVDKEQHDIEKKRDG